MRKNGEKKRLALHKSNPMVAGLIPIFLSTVNSIPDSLTPWRTHMQTHSPVATVLKGWSILPEFVLGRCCTTFNAAHATVHRGLWKDLPIKGLKTPPCQSILKVEVCNRIEVRYHMSWHVKCFPEPYVDILYVFICFQMFSVWSTLSINMSRLRDCQSAQQHAMQENSQRTHLLSFMNRRERGNIRWNTANILKIRETFWTCEESGYSTTTSKREHPESSIGV